MEDELNRMDRNITDGDYSLTKSQMDTIPNVIDGHTLSKMTNMNWLSAYWKNSYMVNPTNYWIAVKF